MIKTLAKIQAELKAPKNQRNAFGKYNYRSCEDILEAVKPLANKLDCIVTVSDEVVEVGNRIYVKATASITGEEGTAKTTAYAREPQDQKGMNEAQITGSASSYARKYALNGLFAIDDTKDADATNEHSKAPKKAAKKVDLPWLNKDTDQFKKVLTAVKGGFTIEQVRTKYSVSKEVEELLKQ